MIGLEKNCVQAKPEQSNDVDHIDDYGCVKYVCRHNNNNHYYLLCGRIKAQSVLYFPYRRKCISGSKYSMVGTP